jgi:succinate-acetate transporter protein
MEASSYGPGGAAPVRREADVAPAPGGPGVEPTGGGSAGFWAPADPGPLGLAGFALTTFVLSMINTGVVGTHSAPGGGLLPLVAGIALAYGGIAQFVAGVWEFRTGNTFGAVAFCSYGGFWISFYLIVHSVGANVGSEVFSGLGLYLWAWGIFTTYMFVASLRTTGAVALVFALLAATYILLGIGNSSLAGGHTVINSTIKIGGWVGVATAIAAWYASFAAVVNSTFDRIVLPVMPLRRV